MKEEDESCKQAGIKTQRERKEREKDIERDCSGGG